MRDLRPGTASSCRSPSRAAAAGSASTSMYSLCDDSNPNAWMPEAALRLLARRVLRLLARLRRLRGRAGGVRARAVRGRRPRQGARDAHGRAGALPLRHLPDGLDGRRAVRHPAGRRSSRCGGAGRSGSSRSARRSCWARRASSRSTASRTGSRWRRRAGAETIDYAQTPTSSRRAARDDRRGRVRTPASTPWAWRRTARASEHAYDRVKQAVRLETDRPDGAATGDPGVPQGRDRLGRGRLRRLRRQVPDGRGVQQGR